MRIDGYRLLQDGLVELSQVERKGIRIDTTLLAKTKVELATQIRTLQKELVTSPLWTVWKKRFGEKANLRSHTQQAVIFYQELGYKATRLTATGRPVMDEEAMQDIPDPFAQKLLRLSKYEKALGTFLRGIEQEIQGDRLHPAFSLHTARSFRGASDSPNFQNLPVRDKEIAKIIRSLFIASKGCVLVENDFKGLEVTLSAAYHKDPVFISYISDPSKDMHRDMAAQIFMLKPGEVEKTVRYCNPGEAPILMGDLSTKLIQDVRLGDEIMGWRGYVEGLVKARVTYIAKREAEVVKLTMASGRVIRCTPTHLWLNGDLQIRQGNWQARPRNFYIEPALGATLAFVSPDNLSTINQDIVTSIAPDGKEVVYSLTTTTGNYVAWGYASKNCAKNMFVFPQFYGDFYVSCAKSLWNAIRKLKLMGPDDKSLYKHLRLKGIKKLGACDPEQTPKQGTFEAHLQAVEKDFWERRFHHYGKWKKSWYAKYLKRGYFDILSGFRVKGAFRRNQVVNLPVQGAAFHCLLWTLIQVNRILRKRKMRSRVVGQIHDSLLGDVRVNELREYLSIIEDVTMRRLPQHWKWLIVPPVIEYELSLPDKTWFDKQPFQFRGGLFVHPRDAKRVTSNTKAFLRALATTKK